MKNNYVPPKVTKKTKKALIDFLEGTPPQRLSRNLRNMLLLWLQWEKGDTPCFTDDLLFDLYNLFELLEAFEGEG